MSKLILELQKTNMYRNFRHLFAPCIIRLPDCHTYSIYVHTYSDTKPHSSLCGSHNQQALVGGVQGQRRRCAGCHTSYIKETMVYTLHQPVTLDEAMIPFKGHLTFKQHMNNKPTKWGTKVFCPEMVTYIEYRLLRKNLDSDVDVGLYSRVLLKLMFDLHGHHLYTDNYYTSPEVFKVLLLGAV